MHGRAAALVLSAWVLWIYGEASNPARGIGGLGGRWVPKDGYETRVECDQGLVRVAASAVAQAEQRGQRAEFREERLVIAARSGSGVVTTYTFRCLPVGTDPREQRGPQG